MNTLILHRATLSGPRDIKKCQKPEMPSYSSCSETTRHQPHHKVAHEFRMNTLILHRTTTTTTPPYLAREMSRNGKNQKCHPSFFTSFLLKDQLHQQSGKRASCEHSNPPPRDYHHHHDATISRSKDIKKCQEPELIHHFHILLAQRSTTSTSLPPRILVYTAMKKELSQTTTTTTTPQYPDPETSRNAKNQNPSFIFTPFLLKHQLVYTAKKQLYNSTDSKQIHFPTTQFTQDYKLNISSHCTFSPNFYFFVISIRN